MLKMIKIPPMHIPSHWHEAIMSAKAKSVNKKKIKSVIDPEESQRRKFRAKCRFRAIGRLVMANATWLSEEVFDKDVQMDDVKKYVLKVVHAQKKKKQLLNLNDKAILNKPAEWRTEKEKHYLYKIIGGLKCFRRYPASVKRKLAAATYFRFYGPGRVIVRQNHEAHAMFFLLTGEVGVSIQVFDELVKEWVEVELGTMHPGDMFGEVSLLHNIPRTATCTSNTKVELLYLMKDDFKNVLMDCVQKQWDEIKRAMACFTYFDELDEVSQREGCVIAKTKNFSANETIIGDGLGLKAYVYFILSGKCQMIENFMVVKTVRPGKVFYKLYDPMEESDSGNPKGESKCFCDESGDVNIDIHKTLHGLNSASRSQCAVCKSEAGSTAGGASSTGIRKKPSNAKTVFMQVCFFNPGSCFGLGEPMNNRRIVAQSPVESFLLPRIWLMQRNTACIWSRIKHFLEKKIPTTKQLFQSFVMDRKWNDYKDGLIEEVLRGKQGVNCTTIHDVPYSIRLEEELDF